MLGARAHGKKNLYNQFLYFCNLQSNKTDELIGGSVSVLKFSSKDRNNVFSPKISLSLSKKKKFAHSNQFLVGFIFVYRV